MFDNDTVLIGGAEIARRVEELGAEISVWVRSRGGSLVVVWLAEGALYFAADLTRKIACKSMRIHSLKVSSYGDGRTPLHEPRVVGGLPDVSGADVLLIDDILDTGHTYETVSEMLLRVGAASVRGCFLLDKRTGVSKKVSGDFVGFSVEDVFVYGYGLDVGGLGRNVPDIMAAK